MILWLGLFTPVVNGISAGVLDVGCRLANVEVSVPVVIVILGRFDIQMQISGSNIASGFSSFHNHFSQILSCSDF